MASSHLVADQPLPNGIIDLGVGQPAPDLLPLSLMEASCREQLNPDLDTPTHRLKILNYGANPGDMSFRVALADFLTKNYSSHRANVTVDPACLFPVAGASQGISMICQYFTMPGQIVYMETPTYFLAKGIFLDHHLRIDGIPMDEGGMDMDALEAKLNSTPEADLPTLLYTIPSFHNPCGTTMTHERRKRLVNLSRKFGFLIVADEVYQMLFFPGADNVPPPPLPWFDTDEYAENVPPRGGVISVGSFSKILAPGLRVGWLHTSPVLRQRVIAPLVTCGLTNSGGPLCHFTSMMVTAAMTSGRLQAHLELLREQYARRAAALCTALRTHLGAESTASPTAAVKFFEPRGGYFVWVEFDRVADVPPLTAAKEEGVGFKAGPLFSVGGAVDLQRFVRLSFGFVTESQATEAGRRLGVVCAKVRPVADNRSSHS